MSDSGRAAEDRALALLQGAGLTLVERNARAPRGEIDLVMSDAGTLVFVEVRYRQDPTHGSALESIGPRKRSRLIHAASAYIHRYRIDRPCRFDVVAIDGDAEPQWVPGAFDAS